MREVRFRTLRGEMAASTDELTSLPNRASWDERLPQELTRARRVGVACWDGAEGADALSARVSGATKDCREMGGGFVMVAHTA